MAFAIVSNLIVFDTTYLNYLQFWKSISIFASITTIFLTL